MTDEDAVDEVKVFRSEDTDDDTIAESSQQLADDKKDVVLETEMESGRSPVIGSKPGTSAFIKPSPSFPNIAQGLAASGFSPSYPFPMLMPWIMAPAYGMRATLSPNLCFMPAALSPSFNMFNPTSPLYGLAAKHMESVPLTPNMRGHPLNPLQLNQMRMPYLNPMMNTAMKEDKRMHGGGKSKKEDHIKKPLNAFMWFMKENRPKLMEEMGNKEKQSAELNKELGKRWQNMSKAEQERYFELARKDREDHKQKYPQWSARENYAIHKRKKKRRDKSIALAENGESKKCRARFGVNNQESWCKFCKRKKKCEYSSDRSIDGMSMDLGDQGSGSTGPSPLASSVGRSPAEANASDSESDIDDDDDEEDIDQTLHQQIQEVAMQEETIH